MPRFIVLTADYAPWNWSGIGVSVAHQCEALGSLGCDVQVLVASPLFKAPPAASARVRVQQLSSHRFPFTPEPADVVHVHSLRLTELALNLARRFALPLFYTAHSIVQRELSGTEKPWIGQQAKLFEEASHVFLVSRDEWINALDRHPSLHGRSSILMNSVPVPPMRQMQPEGGPIVFAGRFCYSKGIDVALRAAELLAVRSPARQFLFAGGHGNPHETAAVQEIVRRFPENCRSTGWLSRARLDDVFSHASMVVVPSRYEPFGLVALEAMRMGAPVLAANVGGLAEVVKDGSGGRLIEGHSPENWAAACEEMLANPETMSRLRRQGPEYVARHFDVSFTAAELVRYTESTSACLHSVSKTSLF